MITIGKYSTNINYLIWSYLILGQLGLINFATQTKSLNTLKDFLCKFCSFKPATTKSKWIRFSNIKFDVLKPLSLVKVVLKREKGSWIENYQYY